MPSFIDHKPRTKLERLAGWFMPGPQAVPFRLEQRIDLVPAADPPLYGPGRYIVFDWTIPKGEAYVVKGIAGCCWQRVNIGGVNATFERMNNQDCAGKVLFTPLVNQRAAVFSQNVHNRPTTLAGAATVAPYRSAGFTTITEDPDKDLGSMWYNPLYSFVVRSGEKLQVLFEILPVTSGETLEVSADAAVTNRIDFAGAYVVGQILRDDVFSALAGRK